MVRPGGAFLAQPQRLGRGHGPGDRAEQGVPRAPDANSNQIKDPDEWVSGHEPMNMTGRAGLVSEDPVRPSTMASER